MSNEQGLEGLEQKRQWLKFGEALAENEKFMEALLSVKPIPKLPNVGIADMVEITYVANEQAMLAMTDAVKADPQLWSDGTTIWGKLGEQIADDIERMGAKLIELGFPDPRKDFSNWRIIALMVGADPDGMMDDIFEHAVAYHAKRERDAKLEAPENQPVAPVVVAADISCLIDGLSPDGLTLRWGGILFPFSPTAARVVKLLFDAFRNGFPYLHEEYLKTESETDTDMRRLVKDNGLESIVIRENRPDGSIVKGKWGLIDPLKINCVSQ